MKQATIPYVLFLGASTLVLVALFRDKPKLLYIPAAIWFAFAIYGYSQSNKIV